MRNALLLGLLTAGLTLASTAELPAHGGQYRGPEDVVPPNPGTGRGGTPRPTGPGLPGNGPVTPRLPGSPVGPGPGAPNTGGGAGPRGAGGRGPVTIGGGLTDDLTRWTYWWEFNKDPFIKLREAVHDSGAITRGSDVHYFGADHRVLTRDTLKPTRTEILERVLPALVRALEGTTQRDIRSSCMVAMAKIGEDGESVGILPAFEARLRDGDQEVRETAAVAFGISQRTEALPILIELVSDSATGRALCDRSEVDDRTRSFAAYGLGLVAHATTDVDVKRRSFECLRGILEDVSIVDRNVRVAAINAIALLRPSVDDPASRELFVACDKALDAFWNLDLGPGEQLIQAHVPTAIAKLYDSPAIAEDDELAARLDRWRERFLAQLEGDPREARANDTVTQSAIVALGRTTGPDDGEKAMPDLDRRITDSLRHYFGRGRDQQARYFALIALGEIGGERSRSFLLRTLATGQKVLEKPWAALALGVMAHRSIESGGADADSGIGRALLDELREAASPDTRSALAVALGLTRHLEAGDTLRELLIDNAHQDELAGYLCIGLALMGDQRATEPIRSIVAKSVRRPALLRQAAVALGKLGDKQAADLLVELMSQGDPNLAKMSAIASALGFIGDRYTIDPLIRMLHDDGLTAITRAFAAVALGGVADKEMLPWNSKIGANGNYRAAVETLTNQASGILDIL